MYITKDKAIERLLELLDSNMFKESISNDLSDIIICIDKDRWGKNKQEFQE